MVKLTRAVYCRETIAGGWAILVFVSKVDRCNLSQRNADLSGEVFGKTRAFEMPADDADGQNDTLLEDRVRAAQEVRCLHEAGNTDESEPARCLTDKFENL